MKAIRAHAAGGPEVLSLDELPSRAPGPGEARVRLAFAGVNFIDVYHRTGLYDPGPRPASLGREGAGVVDAVGAASRRSPSAIGWRSPTPPAPTPTRSCSRADRLLPVPAGVSDEAAAALPLQGMTADYLVRTIGRVAAGDRVLVHAAAGGVGRLAVQMAKAAGATVFGTCSTHAKAEIARAAGCDQTILYTEVDFADAVLAATGGRGCDLVLDGVGTRHLRGARSAPPACAARWSSTASRAALIEPVSPRPALGSRTLVAASLFDYVRERAELLERWRRVADLVTVADGSQLAIDRILPLAEAGEAHRLLESRATSGKLLLDCR